jgi:hypothetical protein
VAVVKTDVLEAPLAYIIRVNRISKLRTTLPVTSLLILFILMMEAIHSSETTVSKEPHGVTSQKMAFFIVGTV